MELNYARNRSSSNVKSVSTWASLLIYLRAFQGACGNTDMPLRQKIDKMCGCGSRSGQKLEQKEDAKAPGINFSFDEKQGHDVTANGKPAVTLIF